MKRFRIIQLPHTRFLAGIGFFDYIVQFPFLWFWFDAVYLSSYDEVEKYIKKQNSLKKRKKVIYDSTHKSDKEFLLDLY